MVVSNVINDLIGFFFFLWSKWPSFFHFREPCGHYSVKNVSLCARSTQYIFTEVHWIILMTFAHFHSALSCGFTRSPSPSRCGEDGKGQGLSCRDAGGFVHLGLFWYLKHHLRSPHLTFTFFTPDSVLALSSTAAGGFTRIAAEFVSANENHSITWRDSAPL